MGSTKYILTLSKQPAAAVQDPGLDEVLADEQLVSIHT